MNRKLRYIAAGMVLALGLSACAEESSAVPVICVDELTRAAAAADRFAGVVVSDNAVQVSKESDKAIDEILVKQGDQVMEGDKLFSYDTDELNLTLEKQQLDMARLDAEIKDAKEQITVVEKLIKENTEKKVDTTSSELNLRQLKATLAQAEYDKSALQAEIDYTRSMLANVSVYSPINGTIRSIDEADSESYIVIQQTGAYRVKGLLNEMSMGMGIMEGAAVQVVSRLNPDQVWYGFVEMVDYENTERNSYDQMYYGGTTDGMSNTTSYPFYIQLESTEGLLLGQHVYIQLAIESADPESIYLPEDYLFDVITDPLGTVTASVWVVGEEGTLEEQIVGLGEYDLNTGSYQITSGLSGDDYVADPEAPGCEAGAEVVIPNQTDDSEETSEGQEGLDESDDELDSSETENQDAPVEDSADSETDTGFWDEYDDEYALGWA